MIELCCEYLSVRCIYHVMYALQSESTLRITNSESQHSSQLLNHNTAQSFGQFGTNWIALHVNFKSITYFDSFEVEHIPKEIENFVNNKNITANIFRIQAYDSVMCGYFCIGFITFMFKGNILTDFTNLNSLTRLFSPNNFKKKKER